MAGNCFISRLAAIAAALLPLWPVTAQEGENVWLEDMPDYTWHAGCFGTASGNLIGYWDRHGFPNMYTGPTGGGLAPLTTGGQNVSIRSLWASQQGLDGRPMNKPGHIEDYWHSQDGTGSFEQVHEDPYVVLGRAEHAPDCLGDFIGQSQQKYDDLNGECSGNIDGYAFNFWDKTGARRTNFVPARVNGEAVRDIQSGLAAWSRYRGYGAETTSQLANVNPEAPVGTGFTFDDIVAEIRAGYPVMLMLQNHHNFSRPLLGNPRAYPSCHAIIVFGYVVTDGGESRYIRFMSSWGAGEMFAPWNSEIVIAQLPLRGAITYHPEPRVTQVQRAGSEVRVHWEGPNSTLFDFTSQTSTPVHRYVVERANILQPDAFTPVTEPLTDREAVFPDTNEKEAYFRVRLVPN